MSFRSTWAFEPCIEPQKNEVVRQVNKLGEVIDTKDCQRIRSLKIRSEIHNCLNSRFKRCYPDLKKTITKRKLSILFDELTQDPSARHHTGGGACYERAKYLSHILAQKGYSARILSIDYAPTLIAFDLNKKNERTGDFYDYKGYHGLIEIDVEAEDGKVEPYLVDTQFMTKPMPREQYFKATIGQNCKKVKERVDYSKRGSMLDCYYYTSSQNIIDTEITDFTVESLFSSYPSQQQSLQCGWTFSDKGMSSSGNGERSEFLKKKNNELRIMNEEKLSARFQDKKYSKGVAAEIIKHRYEDNLRKRIEKEIGNLKAGLRNAQAALKRNFFLFDSDREYSQGVVDSSPALIKQYEKDLQYLPFKIEEVTKNLE